MTSKSHADSAAVARPSWASLLGLIALPLFTAGAGCLATTDTAEEEPLVEDDGAALAATPLSVNLRTYTGNYLVADSGGGGALKAYSTWAKGWETFSLSDLNGGALVGGDLVTLKGSNGQWVSAANGGGGALTVTAPWENAWEQFRIVKLNGAGEIGSGDKIALQASAGGQFVSAINGGGGDVTASAAQAREWETLTLLVAGSGGAGSTGFLTRQGTQLYLDGAPYKAVGANAYGMTGCTASGAYADSVMDAFFKSLRPRSLTRAWAFESQGIEAVKRLVHLAEVNNQMLILSLGDAHADCGDRDGVPSGKSSKGAAWYAGGYRTKYIPWVRQVVEQFKGSRAIGMWEILNEEGAGDGGGADDQTMRAFLDDAAATIKSIDPNHLVESGSQAEYISGTSNYAYVHGGPNVDVGSLHEYDYDYNGSRAIVSGHFDPTLKAMQSIGKPLLIGETGIKANDGGGCSTDRTTRSDAFRRKFDAYLSGGAAAVIVWNWFPDKQNGCEYETIYPGDPAMQLLRSYAP